MRHLPCVAAAVTASELHSCLLTCTCVRAFTAPRVQDAEAYKATAAHVELAKKMAKRDSATAPQVGERVAFVIVKGAKGAKASDKAEDPIFALEHNLPIDAQHYLDHHLSQPLLRIFEPIMGEKRAKGLLTGVPRSTTSA